MKHLPVLTVCLNFLLVLLRACKHRMPLKIKEKKCGSHVRSCVQTHCSSEKHIEYSKVIVSQQTITRVKCKNEKINIVSVDP